MGWHDEAMRDELAVPRKWAPRELVRVQLRGCVVDFVSVRPQWQTFGDLETLHAQLVELLDPQREDSPPVRMHTNDSMSWDELMDLQRRLLRYNEARSAAPTHLPRRIKRSRHLVVQWTGTRPQLLDGDKRWALSATAQSLSDELTEIFADETIGPDPVDHELAAAAADLGRED